MHTADADGAPVGATPVRPFYGIGPSYLADQAGLSRFRRIVRLGYLLDLTVLSGIFVTGAIEVLWLTAPIIVALDLALRRRALLVGHVGTMISRHPAS